MLGRVSEWTLLTVHVCSLLQFKLVSHRSPCTPRHKDTHGGHVGRFRRPHEAASITDEAHPRSLAFGDVR